MESSWASNESGCAVPPPLESGGGISFSPSRPDWNHNRRPGKRNVIRAVSRNTIQTLRYLGVYIWGRIREKETSDIIIVIWEWDTHQAWKGETEKPSDYRRPDRDPTLFVPPASEKPKSKRSRLVCGSPAWYEASTQHT